MKLWVFNPGNVCHNGVKGPGPGGEISGFWAEIDDFETHVSL